MSPTAARQFASEQKTPYEVLRDVGPRLLSRGADAQTVTLLGQGVSDVLHGVQRSGDETVVLQVVADLESARADALSDTISKDWALPLTALLGVLRQYLHDRMVDATSVNPSSHTLRDRVMAALRAGVDTPTTIGSFVNSPPTVVSRVLRQLSDDGLVERVASNDGDKRVRQYRRKPSPEQRSTNGIADTAPAAGLTNPQVLISFVERQIEHNPRLAQAALPDLISIGMAPDIPTAIRVGALGAACVVTRASEGPNAMQDALDLSELLDNLARRSGDKLLLARAAYERARAGLFAEPDELDRYLSELDSAEAYLEGVEGREALMRRGWCHYTRSIIHDRISPARAILHMTEAARLFAEADYPYGAAASQTILARAYYAASAPADAFRAVQQASSLANRHGFLRIMAESSFWTGEVLLAKDPSRETEHHFKVAGELFAAVGSATWSAQAEASSVLARVEGGTVSIDENEARDLLDDFVGVWQRFAAAHLDRDTFSRSWATAVLARRLGALARRAGRADLATESYEQALESYLARRDVLGATVARAGLAATRNHHKEVRHTDVQEAMSDSTIGAGEDPIDDTGKQVILSIEDNFSNELRATP